MKLLFLNRWLAARLLLIAVNVTAIASISPQQTDIDYGGGGLICLSLVTFLFFWLTVMRFKTNVDWSEPFSWSNSFWPMKRYPLRFWMMVPYSLIPAGAIKLLIDFLYYRGHLAFGVTIFMMGFLCWVTLAGWIRWRSNV